MNIAVRVQPRAKRNALVPWQDGRWKLYLTAPAIEGKANAALIEFFSRGLGIARSRARILSGETSRDKRIALDGVAEEQLHSLAALAGRNPRAKARP
jgi:uncharacterized protein (TIGR00251 family)